MSLSKIDNVPDVAMLVIFKHLPLNDLLRVVGSVCERWKKLQRVAYYHRARLLLGDSATLARLPSMWHELELDEDDGKIIERMHASVPFSTPTEALSMRDKLVNLKHLTIACAVDRQLLMRLFEPQLLTKLASLKMFLIPSSVSEDDNNIRLIIDIMQSLGEANCPSLKQLTCYCPELLEFEEEECQSLYRRLTKLRTLEELVLNLPAHPFTFFEILKPFTNLKRFTMLNQFEISVELEGSDTLTCQLTHLSIDYDANHVSAFEFCRFMAPFSSLQFLRLSVMNLSLDSLLRGIVNLAQLEKLSLTDCPMGYFVLEVAENDDQADQKPIAIKSVTYLRLQPEAFEEWIDEDGQDVAPDQQLIDKIFPCLKTFVWFTHFE